MPTTRLVIPIVGLALGTVFALGLAVNTFIDPDLWHEMALIREAFRTGNWPMQDPFAYTPTVTPVVHHEWGTGLVLYAVSMSGGAAGLLALKYLLSAAIAVGTVITARRCGAGSAVLCAALPVAMFLSWIGFTTVRAQMFTLLGLVLLMFCLEQDRRGARRWIAPWLIGYLLWINLHGGFVVGLLLFVLHLLEQSFRRRPARHLLGVLLAMLALIAVNPYGSAYYRYIWDALRIERPLITEWAPLWKAWSAVLFFYGLSLMLVLYAALRRGVRSLPGLVLVLAAALAALRHQRHLSLYAVIWLCSVPGWLEPTPLGNMLRRAWARRTRELLIGAAIVSLAAGITLVRQQPWKLPLPANRHEDARLIYPVGAVQYLRDCGFQGNLMTPFTVGAFVSWKLHPDVRVSIDGRYEVAYPTGLLEDIHGLYDADPGWEKTLQRYPTDAVLVPQDSAVRAEIDRLPGWRKTYQDDIYAIYARRSLYLPETDRRGQTLVGRFP